MGVRNGTYIGGYLNQLCSSWNDNDCSANLCAVESRFYFELYYGTLWRNEYNRDYEHYKGTFDHTKHCHTTAEKNTSEKFCCGDYPERKWFHEISMKDGMERSCCADEKIYFPNLQQCCENGSVTYVG